MIISPDARPALMEGKVDTPLILGGLPSGIDQGRGITYGRNRGKHTTHMRAVR